MASRMTPSELKEYMEKMVMEADAAHDGLMDLSLYAEGAVTYSDLLQMPMRRIKQFQERLERKLKGKSGSTKLEPGKVSQEPNPPKSYAETR